MMSYSYRAEREFVFSEEGQELFLNIRDQTHRLTKAAGAVTLEAAIRGFSGDTFQMMACVDRLVEIGELKEVQHNDPSVSQSRIFFRSKP